MNKDRIIKLLNLTTSDNDHEALSAIRSVNKLLKQNNQMWDDVIRDGIKVEYQQQYQQSYQRPPGTYEEREDIRYRPTGESINELLGFCMARLAGKHNSTAKFVDGLYDYYKKHKILSEKQYKALRDIALDLQNGRRR